MKNVLLTVVIDTHFVELLRLARLLSTTNKYHPVFWFQYNYSALERDLEVCRSEKWDFIAPKTSVSEPAPVVAPKKGVWNFIKKIIKKILLKIVPARILTLVFFKLEIKSQKAIIDGLITDSQSILEEKSIDLIVLCEDNVGYLTNILTGCGKELGIPTVVLPYTICNASEAAEYHYPNPAYWVSSTVITRLTAKKYPHWVFVYHGRALLRLLPSMIWAIEDSKYPYAKPWQINSDPSTLIAVENEHMRKYYQNEGIDAHRMILTGALYDDILSTYSQMGSQKKEQIIHEYGCKKGLPLLLCALPPSQFPRICEFENYDDLLRFWMNSLMELKDWNVLIRPHPRQSQEDIKKIEEYGLQVTMLDTASLVPLCDLYLASVSATIRWAIACGKPVINYDVYHMHYADYMEVAGVLYADNQVEYQKILHQLTSDKINYQKVRKNQEACSQDWGILDGKSSYRITKLFDEIISKDNNT